MKTTIKTTETQEEYPNLPKSEKDRKKDKCGFVGGLLKDNRRKRENIVSRSMLTLDADNASIELISNFENLCEYKAALYTTHSHQPVSPRCRIIIPLTREVTTDEYIPISRYYTRILGIDMFDESSYRPHQLMYLPITPSNGEFIFKEVSKNWLNPGLFLAAYPNWRDCTLLPTSSKESSLYKPSSKKQEDPLTKKGIIGAFCRTYGIEEAIAKFISVVYKPSIFDGRYDYIPAASSARVIIYDNKFSFSHHTSDPACNKLINVFDLIRIHKFGHLDIDGDTATSKSPSFVEMNSYAINDEKVKELITKEKIEEAGLEFVNNSDDWINEIEVNSKGEISTCFNNFVLILKHDKKLNNIKYDFILRII